MDEQQPGNKWNWSDKLAIALTCLTSVTALVLFWLEKTPLTAGLSLWAMAVLMVYPVLHFVRQVTARIIVFCAIAALLAVFGWRIWPSRKLPRTQSAASPSQATETQQSTPSIGYPTPQRRRVRIKPSIQPSTVNLPPRPVAQGIQPPSQSCPNGICISGGIVDNPTVNNYGTPEPTLTWMPYEWPADRPKVGGIIHPDAYAQISLDHPFYDAKFVVFCDRPCNGAASCGGFGFIQTRYQGLPEYPNAVAFLVDGPDPVPADTTCILGVQSEDQMPVRIVDVKKLRFIKR